MFCPALRGPSVRQQESSDQSYRPMYDHRMCRNTALPNCHFLLEIFECILSGVVAEFYDLP